MKSQYMEAFNLSKSLEAEIDALDGEISRLKAAIDEIGPFTLRGLELGDSVAALEQRTGELKRRANAVRDSVERIAAAAHFTELERGQLAAIWDRMTETGNGFRSELQAAQKQLNEGNLWAAMRSVYDTLVQNVTELARNLGRIAIRAATRAIGKVTQPLLPRWTD